MKNYEKEPERRVFSGFPAKFVTDKFIKNSPKSDLFCNFKYLCGILLAVTGFYGNLKPKPLGNH
jgi:hypothetical protein